MAGKKNIKRKRCHNCRFASESFKVVGKTHYHCLNEELYPPAEMEKGETSPWDTLREFWNTCDKHKLNIKIKWYNTSEQSNTGITATLLLNQ